MSFNNEFEYFAYKKIYNKSNIKWINCKIHRAYKLLGYISFDSGDYKESLNYYNKALKYNPMDEDTMLEILYLYKNKEEFI